MVKCDIDKQNLGLSKCIKLPNMPRSMVTTPLNFFIPKATIDLGETAIKEFLQDAIIAGKSQRIYLWPNFVGFENISEEAVYEDSPLAYLAVRDGNYRFKFMIKEGICLHKAMFTHRSTNGRAYLFDIENQLIGTENVDGDFYGFTYQLLNTEKFMISDGSVSTKSPIVLALANNKELDQDGAILDASFVNTLDRLTDVTLTVISAAVDEVVVSVKTSCDETPVNGLAMADFSVTTTAGAAQVLTGATESGDGEYTLTGSVDFEDGFVTLVAANALSVQAYESIGKVALAIP